MDYEFYSDTGEAIVQLAKYPHLKQIFQKTVCEFILIRQLSFGVCTPFRPFGNTNQSIGLLVSNHILVKIKGGVPQFIKSRTSHQSVKEGISAHHAVSGSENISHRTKLSSGNPGRRSSLGVSMVIIV